MLSLAGVIDSLTLERGWSGKGGISLEFVELSSEQGVLLLKISLKGFNVRELVCKVLRGCSLLDKSMSDRLGVGCGRVESYSCGCKGI